jgi:alcohol dehydrogenase class IV
MVHAIEAFTSKRLKNAFSDALALEALRLLNGNLLQACENPRDLKAREAMLVGASLAGLAFANAPVAAVHALAYPIGAKFHVPHGLSNSLVLPAVLRFNLPYAEELYAQIGYLIAPSESKSTATAAMAMIDRMSSLAPQVGLPTQLSKVGITKSDIASLAQDAMQQERLLVNNPRAVSVEEATAIYHEVL